MMKKILVLFILCIFTNMLVNLNAQNSIENIDGIFGEDLINVFRNIDENRRIKQSEILNYDSLPGTFWVVAEPYIIDGEQHFLEGYLFFTHNYMLEVRVVHNSTIDINELKALSISPFLYIAFIYSFMAYNIVDEKITVFDEVFCYLEDTYLYFNRNDEYRKYRLESIFSIYYED